MALKKHHWVRIKSGLYNGDLGLVEGLSGNNKVWLRVIPRIDLNQKKVENNQKNKANRFMSIRPPPKAFNPEDAKKLQGGVLETKKESDLGGLKSFFYFKRQHFRKGFLYKQFNIK